MRTVTVLELLLTFKGSACIACMIRVIYLYNASLNNLGKLATVIP